VGGGVLLVFQGLKAGPISLEAVLGPFLARRPRN